MTKNKNISRRDFLVASAAIISGFALKTKGFDVIQAVPPEIKYPNKFHRDRGIVIIPDKGELYIAADFHSRYDDFKKWLSNTRIYEKLKEGENVYGLILGDIVDIKPNDNEADKTGDVKILNKLMKIRRKLGKRGNRLIYIMGNHEHANVDIYRKLKKYSGLNIRNKKQLVDELFDSEAGEELRQFNFLKRVRESHYKYLKELPLVVLCKNGVVAAHAGPALSAANLEDIAGEKEKVVKELVGGRGYGVKEDGYSEGDVLRFLKMMEDAKLLITGHTPLGELPPESIKKGIGHFGNHQVILGTSYGHQPGKKTYLKIDLTKRYKSADDLRIGEEILRL